MKTIVVAVDGPAGSGKSSVSRRVAAENGLEYIDSGALYRSVTLAVLNAFGSIPSDDVVAEFLSSLSIDQNFLPEEIDSVTYLNGENVSTDIRDELVSKNIGPISDNSSVRAFVNDLLRSWSKERSIIMDGRDIGSVVFPQADVKIYLDASVDIRTQRRTDELRLLGKNVDESAIKKQIILRDEQDMNRAYGALVRTDDAHYIDTSGMTRDAVIDAIGTHIERIRR